MRYSLTGATGFVGGALARRLREEGHDVRALIRDPRSASRLAALGIELVPGDLDDAVALDSLCTDTDGLFHVAGWYRLGQRDASLGERVNVDGTRNVLQAARRCNTPRIVYTSTLAVNSDTHGTVVDEKYRFDGRHLSAYDLTKARAHAIAQDAARDGTDIVIAQPGLVYGPGDTSQFGVFIAEILRGRRPLVPRGGGVCWGYIDDIVDGHVRALRRGVPGQSYMLAGPRESLLDGLALAARIAGVRGPRAVPSGLVRVMATIATPLGAVLPPLYQAETLRSSQATYFGSPAKAQHDLGWVTRSIEQGLTATIAAANSH